MKILKCVLLLLCACLSITAQVPNSFKYQAVLRDNSGNPKANQNVTIGIAIIQDNPDAFPVYQESQGKFQEFRRFLLGCVASNTTLIKQ